MREVVGKDFRVHEHFLKVFRSRSSLFLLLSCLICGGAMIDMWFGAFLVFLRRAREKWTEGFSSEWTLFLVEGFRTRLNLLGSPSRLSTKEKLIAMRCCNTTIYFMGELMREKYAEGLSTRLREFLDWNLLRMSIEPLCKLLLHLADRWERDYRDAMWCGAFLHNLQGKVMREK